MKPESTPPRLCFAIRQAVAAELRSVTALWALLKSHAALGARRFEVRLSTRNSHGQSLWRVLGFRDFVDVLDLRL